MRRPARPGAGVARAIAELPGVFIHPQAILESSQVGRRTRIWAFVHVLPRAVIGADCNLCDHVFIENDVRIGDRVTVKCGVQLWDGVTLEDDVFVGPNVTFTNDAFPRSRRWPERFLPTLVKCGASVGANATILPGLTIGRGAMVGAGAVVTRDVPPNAIVAGNPATVRGYADRGGRAAGVRVSGPSSAERQAVSRVGGAAVVALEATVEKRGAATEPVPGLPFEARRVFLVDGVNREAQSAHREQHSFLICTRGECSLLVDDGRRRAQIKLDSPRFGVHVPPMVWVEPFGFSDDAMLLVLASGRDEGEGPVRVYDEFVALTARRGAAARPRLRRRRAQAPGKRRRPD